MFSTLIATSLFSLANEELCYKVQVNGGDNPQEFVVNPITTFPSGHIMTGTYEPASYKTAHPQCGQYFKTGDKIPGHGWWADGYSALNTSSCKKKDAGGIFYAYNSPAGASSNTGFETQDSLMVYFISDANNVLSLVWTFDIPHDKSGGKVIMELEAPELIGNKDIRFSVRDDPHEPRAKSGGLAEWDPVTGRVPYMSWLWYPCCTDGAVMTGFPNQNFEMGLKVSNMDGLDTFTITSQDPDSGEVTKINLPASTVLGSSFTVKAETCAAYCAAYSDCGSCSLDANCGWCGATNKCIKTQDAGTCPADFNSGDTCCSTCSNKENCLECGSEEGCAWDFGTSTCLSASSTKAGEMTTCSPPTPEWMAPIGDSECEGCPGGAWNTNGSLLYWCSDHGTCSWDKRECTCDTGWGGAACDVQCPIYNNTICGGNGQCNKDGKCECKCGYEGESCEQERCLDQCGTDTSGYCVIGGCSIKCGLQKGGSCTGYEGVNGTCECAEGYYGPQCDLLCPGLNPDGSGAICGGYGTCNSQGQCECQDCAKPKPWSTTGQQTCAKPEPPVCGNFGQTFCVDNEWTCECMGAFTNDPNDKQQPNCFANDCPPFITINSLTGKCLFKKCEAGVEWIASPGNKTHDTDCRPITVCDNLGVDEYEKTPPTANSDRECETITVCKNVGVEEYEKTPPSSSSDRDCEPINVCIELGIKQYETVEPTTTSQRKCADIVPCGTEQVLVTAATNTSPNVCKDATPKCDTSTQWESKPLTLTEDRKCSPLRKCTDKEYETKPPTYTSNRECEPRKCDTAIEWETKPLTPTSDRECAPLRKCTDNEYEAKAPTGTSNRECEALTVCKPDSQYETVAPTETSNRKCTDATKCKPEDDEVEVQKLTATADRKCAKSDDCVNNQCQNGGICIDGILSYTCDCSSLDYFGDKCEYYNSCIQNPCSNGVCTATVDGAVCSDCNEGWGGACCDVKLSANASVTKEGSNLCKNISTAESTKDEPAPNESTDLETSESSGSSLPAAAIAGIIAAMLIVLMLAGVAYKTQKNAQDVRDAEMALKLTETEYSTQRGILNPQFNNAEPVYADASSPYKDTDHEYSESAAMGIGKGRIDATYETANDDAIDAVYAGASPDMYRDDPTYAMGANGAMGDVDPTYAMGANGAMGDADPIYAMGANGAMGDADPIYAMGATGAMGDAEPVYAMGATGAMGDAEPVYAMGATGAMGDADPVYGIASPEAESKAEATYGLASPEAESKAEATYGLASPEAESKAEATYGLASPEAESKVDATYGLASPNDQTDATYGLASNIQPDATYGIAEQQNSTPSPNDIYGLEPNSAPYAAAQVADQTYGLNNDNDIYSNEVRRDSANNDVYANSTEIAPGVILTNDEITCLEADEPTESDVPDGYLQTYAHRRSSLL